MHAPSPPSAKHNSKKGKEDWWGTPTQEISEDGFVLTPDDEVRRNLRSNYVILCHSCFV